MNLHPKAPSRIWMQTVGAFIWYEVLRFRRLPALALIMLYTVAQLAILTAVAQPRFKAPRQRVEARDGLFGLAPALSTDWRWVRLTEVADGWRRFDASDREPFRRQRLAIDHLLDWTAQDRWWRVRKTSVRDATRDWRTHVREAQAIAFHLDGLDACGDRERYAAVLEAALRHVEDLQPTGAAGAAVTLACDERLLRQLLRHLEVTEAPPEQRAFWSVRLSQHFEALGDLTHPVKPLEARDLRIASRRESEYPWLPERFDAEREFPRYRLTAHFDSELDAFRDAVALLAPDAMTRLTQRESEQRAQELPPQSWGAVLFNLFLGRVQRLPARGEARAAVGAYRQHLAWTALRDSVRAMPSERRKPEVAPVSTSALAAVVAVAADAPPVVGPEAPCFRDPAAARVDVQRRCLALGLRPVLVRAERPRGPADLRRARVEVVVRGERFYRLAAVLESPELHAIGGRGEMRQLDGDLRVLAFDVPLAANVR